MLWSFKNILAGWAESEWRNEKRWYTAVLLPVSAAHCVGGNLLPLSDEHYLCFYVTEQIQP
jgi:hypothetical protein